MHTAHATGNPKITDVHRETINRLSKMIQEQPTSQRRQVFQKALRARQMRRVFWMLAAQIPLAFLNLGLVWLWITSFSIIKLPYSLVVLSGFVVWLAAFFLENRWIYRRLLAADLRVFLELEKFWSRHVL